MKILCKNKTIVCEELFAKADFDVYHIRKDVFFLRTGSFSFKTSPLANTTVCNLQLLLSKS